MEVDGDQQRVDIAFDAQSGWDDFHLFRIEKHSDPAVNEVRLFLDNEATPRLAFDLDLLPNNFLDDASFLAETSQNGKSKFELLHFRYRIGTTSFEDGPPDCAADFDNDGSVGTSDLLQLLKFGVPARAAMKIWTTTTWWGFRICSFVWPVGARARKGRSQRQQPYSTTRAGLKSSPV